MPSTPRECPHCGAGHTVRNGTKSNGTQNYKCVDCGRQFVETYGTPLYRLHKDAKRTLVGSYLLNILGTMPLALTADFIELFFGVVRVPSTYYYRHQRFEGPLQDLIKACNFQYSDIWHIDEVFIPVRGSPGKFAYAWIVSDDQSQPISVYISERRDQQSAEIAIRKAEDMVGFKARIIVRDGCPAYNKPIRRRYRTTRGVQAHFKAEPFIDARDGTLHFFSNNRIEGFNSIYRRYQRPRRGFKSFHTANLWSSMFIALYMARKAMPLPLLAVALRQG